LGVFIALSTHCFGSQDFGETCAQIVDLEYDKIELWLDDEQSALKAADLATNPDKFLAMYREHTRLTTIAFHCQQDPGKEVFDGLCRLGKMMRVTQITLPSGQLGTPFNEEIDRLRTRLITANAAGMRLSLKTQNGHLTEDPQTAAELCQAVPGLGLTLDISYYLCGRYASQGLDHLYPYVYHVHMRDTSATELQVPIGLGLVDYARMISQLKRYNYNRGMSVELLPELIGSLDRGLELRKIRMLVETLL
jgi:sugar phosphate isomerase/epimerase